MKIDTTEAEDDYRDYRHELVALRAQLEEVEKERDRVMQMLLHKPIGEIVELRKTLESSISDLEGLFIRNPGGTP